MFIIYHETLIAVKGFVNKVTNFVYFDIFLELICLKSQDPQAC